MHNFLNICPHEASEVSIGVEVMLFEVVGRFQSQWLREIVYLTPTLGRETKGFFMVG